MTDYSIEALESEKNNINQPQASQDDILPKFPFSFMISGRSGSGKSVLLLNLLTKEKFYGGFFDYIIVYSPTAGKLDDTYKNLDIPPENYVSDFNQETLEELIDSRKDLIDEKGIEWVAENSKVCLVLDDVIANRSFLESQTALKLFALLRHYLCSIFVLTQSYNKIPRALRLNSNATAVFPSSQSEIEILINEITPSGIKKREFEKVIDYCTEDRYSFLYINNHAPRAERVRKNLDEIIDLNTYKKK